MTEPGRPVDMRGSGVKALVLGGTGLLGQGFAREVRRRGWALRTAARNGADIAVDISDDAALSAVLSAESPDLIVNCAALVDVAKCEADPGLAYRVNARPVAILADWSSRHGVRLAHVSTDHFFPEGGSAAHDEADGVALVNEYARSKFAAEAFALTAPRALVLRTSIVGIRGWSRLTFAEWAIRAVLHTDPVDLFTDAFSSSIDVPTFARAALDLCEGPAAGVINLAAREVYSKAAFVQEVAAQLGRPLDHATMSSVTTQRPRRPASLGLDVSRAQRLLDFDLPTLPHVVRAILDEHRQRSGA